MMATAACFASQIYAQVAGHERWRVGSIVRLHKMLDGVKWMRLRMVEAILLTLMSEVTSLLKNDGPSLLKNEAQRR
jgi:hypothetical protein